MSLPEIKSGPVLSRAAVLGIAVVALIGGGGAYLSWPGPAAVVPMVERTAPAAVVPAAPVVAPAPAPVAVVPPAAVVPAAVVPAVVVPAVVVPGGPSFDVVRVGPKGEMVVAGRAEAGSEVVVFEGTREIARTRADRRGEFVALPAAPLGAGGRELTLASRGAAGTEVRGDGSVVIVVPEARPVPREAAGAPVVEAPGPVALLVPSAGPPRVLQDGRRAGPGLSLDVVDYDEKGGVRFTGRVGVGGAVRIYVDNRSVGDASGDTGGRWSLTPSEPIAPGVHALRADSLDAAGRVTGRVELPFQRASMSAGEMGPGRVVVQPGQNLWRLARAAYGRGIQYTVIYMANQDQIRDPRLIYPGQAFSLPAGR